MYLFYLDVSYQVLPDVYAKKELRKICNHDDFIDGIIRLKNNSITKLSLCNIFIII